MYLLAATSAVFHAEWMTAWQATYHTASIEVFLSRDNPASDDNPISVCSVNQQYQTDER